MAGVSEAPAMTVTGRENLAKSARSTKAWGTLAASERTPQNA
jgi:hypothetical protein